MRVLLTSDFFHPVIGGAERQVRLLAGELARRGHDVRVATTAQAGLDGCDQVDGVRVDRLPSLSTAVPWFSGDGARRFVAPLPDPRLVLGLRRLLDGWPADVVHANGWIAYASAAALLGRHVPMVLSVRDYGYACATRNLLRNGRTACEGPSAGGCLACAARHYGAPKAVVAVTGVLTGRMVLRRTVRAIHSVSRFVQATVERDLVADDAEWRPILERIADIVPLASAGDRADPGPDEEALLAQLPVEPFVLFVGALQSHKGLGVLLDAHARLGLRSTPPPPLVLIGTRWPDTPATFPDGVTILADVPHSVVMAAWERSLFGVAPSVWADPLPGVVREAMTRCRTVVATAVGGNTDMVSDGETGLLVPPGDAAALAEAMARLIDDGALRDRLGRAARASVGAFGAPAIAACFEALYARAAAAA